MIGNENVQPDLMPGVRVQMTTAARRQFPRRKSYTGVVIRRSKLGPYITVQCDGYKKRDDDRWWAGHWEKAPDTTVG